MEAFVILLVVSLYLFITTIFAFVGRFIKDEELLPHFPKTSVIVAAWNEEKVIEKCVESIFNQDYKNDFELIVIGGGYDTTSKLLKKYTKRKNFRFIKEKEPTGKWNALNTAIKSAKYDTIALIDADAIAPKDWLSNIARPLYKYDLVCGPYVNYNHYDSSIARIYRLVSTIFFRMDKFFDKLSISMHLNGANMAFKKRVWRKEKFKNFLLEDMAFYADAKKHNFRKKLIYKAEVKGQGPTNYKSFSAQHGRFMRGIIELIAEKGSLVDKLMYLVYLLFFIVVPVMGIVIVYLYLTDFFQLSIFIFMVIVTYTAAVVFSFAEFKNTSFSAKIIFDIIVLVVMSVVLFAEQMYIITTGNFNDWTRMERV